MENYILKVTEGWKIYLEMTKELLQFLIHDPRGFAFYMTFIGISIVLAIIFTTLYVLKTRLN